MTMCNGDPAEEVAELYLTGELSESERERFEEHYFCCDACHASLESLRAVQQEFRRDALAGPQPMRIVARGTRARAIPFRLVAFGAVAAMLLIAAGLIARYIHHGRTADGGIEVRETATASHSVDAATSTPRQQSDAGVSESASNIRSDPRKIQLAALADIHLPGYHASQLRGGETVDAQHAAFAAGMRRYADGDCAGTLDDLRAVPLSASDGVAARLYSGLCQFEAGALADAQRSFEAVSAAGDTPQLETADYYLAQVMLLRSDASGASEWLRKTIALHGDFEEKAQAELNRLNRAG